MLDLSIVVVNWNTCELLASCLNSIYATAQHINFDIWVVDNASSDGSVAMLQRDYPTVNLVENSINVGFAKANNQAMALSRGQYILLLNSDAMLTPGSLQSLLRAAERQPNAGILGAQLLNTDGTFQASHTPFPNLWQEFLILSGSGRKLFGRWYPSHGPEEEIGPQQVDYVEGACLLVRRAAFNAVGGLDEDYFMYAEEVDWCYTMRRFGWEVWYEPAAKVIHLGGGSSRQRRTQREADLYKSRVRFFGKHYGPLASLGLKGLIFGLTAIKILINWMLLQATRGRRGRPVVSLNALVTALRSV